MIFGTVLSVPVTSAHAQTGFDASIGAHHGLDLLADQGLTGAAISIGIIGGRVDADHAALSGAQLNAPVTFGAGGPPDATRLDHRSTATAALVAELAPGASITPLVVSRGDGSMGGTNLQDALRHVADGSFHVVALVGGESTSLSTSGVWTTNEVAEQAAAAGVLLIAPVGETGHDGFRVLAPASAPSVLAVGATFAPLAAMSSFDVEGSPAVAGTYPARLPAVVGSDAAAIQGPLAAVDDACGANSYANVPSGAIVIAPAPQCALSAASALAVNQGAVALFLAAPRGQAERWVPDDLTDSSVPVAIIDTITAGALARAAAEVTIDVSWTPTTKPNAALTDTVTEFSARGPAMQPDGTLVAKPEISAVGFGVHAPLHGGGWAEYSDGALAVAYVAATAALVAEARPSWSPAELKSAIVHGSEPVWRTSPLSGGNAAFGGTGGVAPITVGGAGRLAANAVLEAPIMGSVDGGAVIDFGLVASTAPATISRVLTLTNTEASDADALPVAVDLDFLFRDPDQANSGVTLFLEPSTVELGPGESVEVTVSVEVDPRVLDRWGHLAATAAVADSGSAPLQDGVEFDGTVRVRANGLSLLRVPFFLTPRATTVMETADVCIAPPDFDMRVVDTSSVRGRSEVFSLLHHDTDETASGIQALGVRKVDRADGITWLQFGVTLFETTALPEGASVGVWLDVDNDPEGDYLLINLAADVLDSAAPSGTSVTLTLAPDATGAIETPAGRFALVDTLYTVADRVASQRILTADLSAVGLDPDDPFQAWVVSWSADGDTDGVPSAGAGLMPPSAPLAIDLDCGLWELASPSLYVEAQSRGLLESAPTCSDIDGMLVMHLTNDPNELAFEVLVPPTAAIYTCSEEMLEIADTDFCGGTPDYTQHIDGVCDGAVTAAVDGRTSFELGETDVTVRITDYWGNFTSCATTIVMEDRTPPEADCVELLSVSAQTGDLPLDHRSEMFDACGVESTKIVFARCLIDVGEGEFVDVSDTCKFEYLEDGSFRMHDLGREATVVEWVVRGTDAAGNEGQGTCYATVDRDLVVASGSGDLSDECSGAGTGAVLWLASLIGLLWRRRRTAGVASRQA